MDNYNCLYYQAYIEKKKILYFVALLRSIDDNIVFDRIEDPKSNIFEFFVPQKNEVRFIEIMNVLKINSYLQWFRKTPINESSLYNK